MPNIKISDLPPITPGFDPTDVFLEIQDTVAGEPVSRKITPAEITAGASPLGATYITVTPNAILPNERILTGTVNVLSVTDGGAGGNITLDIEAAGIDNARLADMDENRVKGRADATGTGVPIDLTPAQLNGILASGGFATYFSLTATDRVVGSNAGSSNSGDNVFLVNALAGDNNIADGVIAIGENALAAAAQLDFARSVVIGQNAGALMDDTRDPWVIIGSGAVALMPGAAFHDGNTIIGTDALSNNTNANLQGTTIIGHEAGARINGLSAASGNVIIGFRAVGEGAPQTASVTNSVIIGDRAVGDYGPTQIGNCVIIGRFAGQDLSGDDDVVAIGSGALLNASGSDRSVFIGTSCYTNATGSQNSVYIGQAVAAANALGDQNVVLGAQALTTPGAPGLANSVILGFSAGNDIGSATGLFLVESTLGTTSFVNRPYLYGSVTNGNLALLSVNDTSTQDENGTRNIPSWGAANGVWTMSGAGTDLGATADADFLHTWIRNADTALMLQYPSGDTISLLHDGSDAIIQENLIIGLPADGKLFINTLTGTGPIGNIVSATPGLVSIFGAGTDTNGVTGGNVEIWGGYAAGIAPGFGGDVGIWGGGAGGGPKGGGNVRLFGGEADSQPGDVVIIGGTATVGGDGGDVTIDGGPGFGAGTRDGGEVNITGGVGVSSGLGGNLNLAAGAGATTGTGGVVQINGGDSVSAAAGIIQLNGGDVATSGLGGRIVLASGEGGLSSDRGGDIWLIVGQGNLSGASGNIYINSTNGTTPNASSTESPGLVAIFGIGGTGVTAGNVEIRAGLSTGGATGNGGNLVLEGGNSANTNGNGGDIQLNVGTGNGSGVDGTINFTGNVGTNILLDTSGGPAILNENASSSNPVLIPNKADLNTGIGQGGTNILVFIANSAEVARAVSSGGVDQLIVPLQNFATGPSLAFGDGDTGAYESADDILNIATAGVGRVVFDSAGMSGFVTSGPAFLNENASSTNPTLVPNKTDPDTGLGWTSADVMTAVVGGVIAIEMTNGGDVAFFNNGVEVARTDTTANGGFEVDAGDGFFRVLNLQNQELRRVDGDQGFANDIVSSPVSDLTSSLLVASGEHCIIEGMLRFESASATPGVRWQLDVSGAALTDSSIAWTLIIAGGTVEGDIDLAEVDIIHTMGAGVEHVYKFFATFTANASIIPTISFAQNVSNATQTRILDGSWVKYSVVP